MNHRCGGPFSVEIYDGVTERACPHGWRWTSPPPDPERAPGRFAHLTGGYKTRAGLPTTFAPRVAGCRWCKQSMVACVRHGGPDTPTRQAMWRAMRREASG